MSFSKEFNHFVWDDISMSIYAKTARDVERALNKEKLDLEDFKALVSPAAEPYLELMAQKSYTITRKRFGNTISLFILCICLTYVPMTVLIVASQCRTA